MADPAKQPLAGAMPPSSGPGAGQLRSSPVGADIELARLAVEAATKAGASYADARLVLWQRENIGVRDDHIRNVSRSNEYGIGIRVIADGAWGFAATPDVTKRAVVKAAKRAVSAAKASAPALLQPVELVSTPRVVGAWVSPHDVDPFSVSVDDKAAVLIGAAKQALKVPGVAYASASVTIQREEKLLVTSEGSEVHQVLFRIFPSMSATAVDRKRGRFASRNSEVPPMLAGWEHVREADLIGQAPQIAEEALQKLHARSVTPGRKQVVLAPSNLWLTIHESIGHPTELDRAMGLEANYAGTSFLSVEDTGKRQLGAADVNLLADRTQAGGLATTAWDDEGVVPGRWPIVEEGRFVGWQTTRDQAAWIGEKKSRGCCYGDSYNSISFQRMPNISLQPGAEDYKTEDLINSTDDGILITGRGSWSIDHQRYNFQFSGQFFWEIKNGRLTRPLRDVAYQANTEEFWQSCDMLGGPSTYRLGGSFSDGKGQPGQVNAVSHGCVPARFFVDVVNTGESK